MSTECVSAFMSSLGAQLCPQPSIPSIPTRMNRLIVFATLLNSLPVNCGNARCVMCLRIMFVEINIEADTYLFVWF